MNKMLHAFLLLIGSILLFSSNIHAQCKIDNNYFRAGEELDFDLYFKHGILHTKAGKASLKISEEKYKNTDALKMTMLANSSGLARSFFSLNDTVSSYVTKDLVPLSFKKHAHEGSDITLEKITYNYTDYGGINIRTQREKNNKARFDTIVTTNDCIYDMLSVVYYARTLDYSQMKKKDQKTVEFMSGKRKVFMVIEHQGVEKVKANDGNSYECIKLVLSVSNVSHVTFGSKKPKEAMKVYLSNDKNRMPVRMEFQLKVGSTRGILKSYKGNIHPVKSS